MNGTRNIKVLVDQLSKIKDIGDDLDAKVEHFKELNAELNRKLEKVLQKEKEIFTKLEKEKGKQEIEIYLKLEKIKQERAQQEIEIHEKLEKIENERTELKVYENAIERMLKEKSIGFPWFAETVAEYISLQDGKLVDFLTTKKYPSIKGAEVVRTISEEKHELIKQLLIANKMIKYYEYLFPFLTEFRDADIDELLLEVISGKKVEAVEAIDPVKRFVSEAEYQKLSSSERNQRALDRYVSSKKSNARIGKDYERYVGFLYEQKGYKVKYQGIEEGYEDLGRDLICLKDNKVLIVQCKYWASHKFIHEKHINQLFGTTVKYFIEHVLGKSYSLSLAYSIDVIKHGDIRPVMFTSTNLSDTAQKFAQALGVEVFQNQPMKPYPMIKCHISKLTGDKIYHLPFDQQYDRTIIDGKDEFYAMTVKEAEDKGFRRAWKWLGNK